MYKSYMSRFAQCVCLIIGLFSGNYCFGQGKLLQKLGHASKYAKMETLPVSHEDLVKEADRAFVGKVVNIESNDVTLKTEEGASVKVPVQIATFEIEEVLFNKTDDDLEEGKRYKVMSSKLGSRKIREGERVVWFLAPNSVYGLTSPVGLDSGHFEFSKDGQSVINLKRNRGLLRAATVANEVSELEERVSGASSKAKFAAEVGQWASRAANRGSSAGLPIPVDLLISRTKLLLQDE